MSNVNDAIILAGGLGTRMLPASLFMPKETMPLVDTPIINHLIWEAARAGVSRVHLVLSKSKERILRSFIGQTELFDGDVRKDLPRESLSLGTQNIELLTHIQHTAGGVGDAISVALGSIDGPFLVLLGDNLLIEEHIGPKRSGPEHASKASLKLVNIFEESDCACVGICPVQKSEISKYGVVRLQGDLVSEIIEKPSMEDAPSPYVLCGRYLFPRQTKDLIESFPLEEYGELQSIYLLRHFLEEEKLVGVKLDHMKMYDSGEPLSWLKSQVDHALRREDTGQEMSNWIRARIDE